MRLLHISPQNILRIVQNKLSLQHKKVCHDIQTEDIRWTFTLEADRQRQNSGFDSRSTTSRQIYYRQNFYYTFQTESRKHNYEIDFLIADGDKVSPIEVKSSGYKAHASLDAFCLKFSSRIKKRYLIYTKDLHKEGNILYLPIYMTMFLWFKSLKARSLAARALKKYLYRNQALSKTEVDCTTASPGGSILPHSHWKKLRNILRNVAPHGTDTKCCSAIWWQVVFRSTSTRLTIVIVCCIAVYPWLIRCWFIRCVR